MKQTAVEFLETELRERYSLMNSEPIFEQAKEMEKKQIIDAHGIKTKSINQDQSEVITGRQYYNVTFNK